MVFYECNYRNYMVKIGRNFLVFLIVGMLVEWKNGSLQTFFFLPEIQVLLNILILIFFSFVFYMI